MPRPVVKEDDKEDDIVEKLVKEVKDTDNTSFHPNSELGRVMGEVDERLEQADAILGTIGRDDMSDNGADKVVQQIVQEPGSVGYSSRLSESGEDIGDDLLGGDLSGIGSDYDDYIHDPALGELQEQALEAAEIMGTPLGGVGLSDEDLSVFDEH